MYKNEKAYIFDIWRDLIEVQIMAQSVRALYKVSPLSIAGCSFRDLECVSMRP